MYSWSDIALTLGAKALTVPIGLSVTYLFKDVPKWKTQN